MSIFNKKFWKIISPGYHEWSVVFFFFFFFNFQHFEKWFLLPCLHFFQTENLKICLVEGMQRSMVRFMVCDELGVHKETLNLCLYWGPTEKNSSHACSAVLRLIIFSPSFLNFHDCCFYSTFFAHIKSLFLKVLELLTLKPRFQLKGGLYIFCWLWGNCSCIWA